MKQHVARWMAALLGSAVTVGCSPMVRFDPIDEVGEVLCTDGIDNDGDGLSDCADSACAALITCNAAVTAVDDAFETSEDVALELTAQALTANDEGDALTVTTVSGATDGTVELVGTAITFRPAADFVGAATFQYAVSGGATTDVGLVTVMVTAAIDAPVAVDDAAVTEEDTALTLAVADLLVNDADADADVLTVASVQDAVNCTATLEADTVSVIPASDFFGTCTFAYTVTDGTSADVGEVTVTITPINDAPAVVGEAPTTVDEDAPYAYAPLLVDVDGPVALWTLLAADTCGGTLDVDTGAYAFTPVGPLPPASCDLAIQVCDDGVPSLCDIQTATVIITAGNDAPTISSTAPATATEDELFSYAATADDPEGAVGTWGVLATDTCGGTFADSTYSFTPAGPVPPADCVLAIEFCDGGDPDACVDETTTVAIAAVNDAPLVATAAPTTATEDVLYAYAPAILDPDGPTTTWSFAGTHTCGGTIDPDTGAYAFTPAGPVPPATCVVAIEACDGGTPELCVTETATVSITAVNDAPTISSTAPATGTEDDLYTYVATALDPESAAGSWTVLGTDTCGGAFAGNSYSFTPAGPVPPADCVVAIQFCDGDSPDLCDTQTTTVTITAVNDAPVISSTAPATATASVLYTYTATRTDADGPGQTWSLAGAHDCGGSIVAGTGVFTFTPSPAPPPSCVVGIQVCDGGSPDLCVSQTTTISIETPFEIPADFVMLQSLDIPAITNINWDLPEDVPYSVDERTNLAGVPFDRVAYLLELDDQYIWTEMDPFTSDLTQLGVPTAWGFKTPVTNLTVLTNSGLPAATNATGGSIEFWSQCWGPGPDNKYDWDDVWVPADPVGCHGSMQVHRDTTTQLAFNGWAGGQSSVGIGNRSDPTLLDWTVANNVGDFTMLRIGVFIRPTLPTSCLGLLARAPATPSGVYTLDPTGGSSADAFDAYCDMTTDGGGWTKILQYGTGSMSNSSSNAVGTIAVATNTAAAKLADAQINAIRDLSPTGTGEYRLKASAASQSVYIKSTLAFADATQGWGFSRPATTTLQVCNGTSLATCTYGNQTLFNRNTLDTFEWGRSGDNCERYLVDFNEVGCLTGAAYPNRCVSGGASCGAFAYAPHDQFAMWLRPVVPHNQSCASIKRFGPTSTSGVYTLDPDGDGPMAGFSAYCDMSTDGGGWTLIGRHGAGNYLALTTQQYTDLIANPTSDVNAGQLLAGGLPASGESAWYSRAKTNAIYHATPYAEGVVRIVHSNGQVPSDSGTYFQQIKTVRPTFDVWWAIRDATQWDAGAAITPVPNYGTSFALAKGVINLALSTNVLTHNSSGDTSYNAFDFATLSLNDGSTLPVSRHAGLMVDAWNNQDWLWIMTTNTSESRWRNDPTTLLSTIWVR